MNYYNSYRRKGDFEITKREILFSIAIIAFMLLIGTIIHGKISDSLMEEYQKYNTAMQIEQDNSLFVYGMKTDIGKAFIYGDLQAIDTVSYPDIDGKYMYVKKVKEKYTMHTRTVKSGKTYRTETYWTWDYAGEENKHSEKLSFLGVEFDYKKINIPSAKHIDTVSGGYHVRYVYEGVKNKYTGTLFTDLNNKTITDNSDFYSNKTIEETIKSLESGSELIIFWVCWVILTGVIVFVFYYFDNRWLEDKRN